jgi:hypothetical protein
MKTKVEVAHAYTPGLRVQMTTTVRKTRRLSTFGDVLVKEGDTVDFDTIVARTYLPGEPHLLRAAHLLGLEDDPKDVVRYMSKKVGDPVREGEVFAECSLLFGLVKKSCTSPVGGYIESFSENSGYIVIREPKAVVEVRSYVPGKVTEVLPKEGVVVELNAALIQGIFGIGGETNGILRMAVNSPKDILDADVITNQDNEKILVAGSMVTGEAMAKAAKLGVKGIVSGGVNYRELVNFVGHRIGVGITGDEQVGFTLIVTEGFGRMNMSKSVFSLLQRFQGYKASMSGATQIRAGVLRPEIIIPHKEPSGQEVSGQDSVGGMRPGTPVRVIREPHFGAMGKVVSLPAELWRIETESSVRIVEVVLESGEKVMVPRANVEIIEE